MKDFIKKHYHWIIAAVCLLQMLTYGGAANNFSSYHLIPVSEALGISRTAFSVACSIRSCVSLCSTLFCGELIQRYGYRKTAAVGIAVCALAYTVLAFVNSYWMLIVGCVMIGFAHGVCSTAGVSRLINLWFNRRRGTVLGFVAAATGVGSTLLGYMQTASIEYVSWRLSFGSVAGVFAITAVLICLLARDTPKSMGLLPYGDGETVEKKQKRSEAFQWEGFTMPFIKKQPAYYLTILLSFLSCICVLGTQFIFVPYFQDEGMSAVQAGNLYGIMMLLLGIIKLLMGVLVDAIGAKKTLLICQTACMTSLLMIAFLPTTSTNMLIAMIIFDVASPIATMMFPLLAVELFGYQAQTQYIGPILATSAAASIVGSPVSNIIYDAYGSYQPTFVGAAAICLALNVFYMLLFRRIKKDRKKFMASTGA